MDDKAATFEIDFNVNDELWTVTLEWDSSSGHQRRLGTGETLGDAAKAAFDKIGKP